jgi:hypothetical protein
MNKSRGAKIAPPRSTETMSETEEGRSLAGRNPGEKEEKAEVHGLMTLEMNQSSSTSEPYSEVSEEEEKRARIGRPTFGSRSIGGL